MNYLSNLLITCEYFEKIFLGTFQILSIYLHHGNDTNNVTTKNHRTTPTTGGAITDAML